MTELASDFTPTGERQWRKRVESALKGGAFETLVSRSDDSFPIQPLYGRRVGPRVARPGGPWRVLARVDHPDAGLANAQALDDLANGADGLQVVFAGAGGAWGYGLAAADAAALAALFEGVRLDAGLTLELDPGPAAEQQALGIAALVEREVADPGRLDLSFGVDPLGALARSGRAPDDWPATARRVGGFAAALKDRGFAGPFVAADARCVHAAGGAPAQELGFALSAGLDYWRALEGSGFDAGAARSAIAFRLAADADEFISLAKFRALRLLWARAGEVGGAPARPARIHGESAWRMVSARDPWVNVLRGAMAAFSAGLGGADSVSVLPFTQGLGLPDSFARRLARNAQLILLEESRLGFVADPAAGAGAFEALTQDLCEAAWGVLQGLEAQGGLYAALARGDFQQAVAKASEARARDVARRKTPLIGVSDFADLAEVRVETLAAAAPAFHFAGESRAAPLRPHRLAEPYEALRDASDAALARDGARPSVFLANLGPAAAFGARAAFARSLFEAGGVEARGDEGYASAAEAAAAFKTNGAALACLCSSDEIYATMAQEAASSLAAAGAGAVYLVGRPRDNEAAWRVAGVADFVYAGCDALALLNAAHERCAEWRRTHGHAADRGDR
jgi:methylmalonyl-CoA mutase